jgi:hypothetical protein
MFRRQAPSHLPRHLLLAVMAYQLQADQLVNLATDAGAREKRIVDAGGDHHLTLVRFEELSRIGDRLATSIHTAVDHTFDLRKAWRVLSGFSKLGHIWMADCCFERPHDCLEWPRRLYGDPFDLEPSAIDGSV